MRFIHNCECTSNDVPTSYSSQDDSDEDDALLEEAELMREFRRLKKQSPTASTHKIRVFQGGKEGNYSKNLDIAVVNLQLHSKNIIIESIDVDTLRANEWSHPRMFFDWILDSDMHIILCQNIYLGFYGFWDIGETIQETRRLELHYGFPSGKQSRCPVFNGDKYNYLRCAMPCLLISIAFPLLLSFAFPLLHLWSSDMHVDSAILA